MMEQLEHTVYSRFKKKCGVERFIRQAIRLKAIVVRATDRVRFLGVGLNEIFAPFSGNTSPHQFRPNIGPVHNTAITFRPKPNANTPAEN